MYLRDGICNSSGRGIGHTTSAVIDDDLGNLPKEGLP